ncbi:hypothetical protein TNCV_82691 [Trichonephila clavipes]|nr:hypothetical protein TNCV_82691 [Trichonephila clavipes]
MFVVGRMRPVGREFDTPVVHASWKYWESSGREAGGGIRFHIECSKLNHDCSILLRSGGSAGQETDRALDSTRRGRPPSVRTPVLIKGVRKIIRQNPYQKKILLVKPAFLKLWGTPPREGGITPKGEREGIENSKIEDYF